MSYVVKRGQYITLIAFCRIRRAMANMLIQADELRARLLEQLALMLTPRQLALVLMAPLNMLASPL